MALSRLSNTATASTATRSGERRPASVASPTSHGPSPNGSQRPSLPCADGDRNWRTSAGNVCCSASACSWRAMPASMTGCAAAVIAWISLGPFDRSVETTAAAM
jgi:hypothetical protein